MKNFIGAAAFALAMSAGSAFAEEAAAPAQPELPAAAASQCSVVAPPAAPTLPDGAVADGRAMTAGNETYQTWFQEMRPAYDCHRDEYRQALANYQARLEEFRPWNERANGVSQAWEAEVTEYNERVGGGE